ncbi:3-isopropylmalate dehydratase small subunit [Halanaerobaculum tunisiense]
MEFKGTAWKYGDDVDTDVIIPARYLNTSQPEELAKHCLEDLDEEFTTKMSEGDLIVAEDNFGCGSSREHAPLAIKVAGVSCVIANSFARIFYRNSINIGLPILECPAAVEGIAEEDEVKVDIESGTIKNLTQDEEYQAEPFPGFMQEIMDQDGLVNYVREMIKN